MEGCEHVSQYLSVVRRNLYAKIARGESTGCLCCAAPRCAHPFSLRAGNEIYCAKCDRLVYDRLLDATRTHALLLKGKKNLAPFFRLRGLVNLGNTCFISSVMQALLNSNTIANAYLENPIKNTPNWKRSWIPSSSLQGISLTSTKLSDAGSSTLDSTMSFEFEKVLLECCVPDASTEAYAMTTFLYRLWKTSAAMSGSTQQDAQGK